jgi:hypothetical protein
MVLDTFDVRISAMDIRVVLIIFAYIVIALTYFSSKFKRQKLKLGRISEEVAFKWSIANFLSYLVAMNIVIKVLFDIFGAR